MNVESYRPTGKAAAAHRNKLYDRLRGSLEHLVDTREPKNGGAALRLAAGIIPRDRLIRPDCFSTYFKLIKSFYEEADQVAGALAAELCRRLDDPPSEPLPMVRPYRKSMVGTAEIEEVIDNFASDSLRPDQIGWYDDDVADAKSEEIHRALALLSEHAPGSYSEVRETVSEIIPVCGREQGGMTFDGCSSIERWGAILINMKQEHSLLGRAETIVHEGAHSALFAMTCSEFRVLNAGTERYSSPLRYDKRPLDGIYHAVFVLARMYHAMAEVSRSPSASSALKDEARAACARSARNFNDGYSVLAEHARYTPVGRAVMEASRSLVPEVANA